MQNDPTWEEVNASLDRLIALGVLEETDEGVKISSNAQLVLPPAP